MTEKSIQLRCLQAMGIQAWQLRDHNGSTYEKTDTKTDDWESLRQAVVNCTACSLSQSRTQTVFGVGNIKASVMIIGEAPGFYEDKQGEPFVGRAGQLLNAMLQSIGLMRGSVYIANILKCRPPDNRDPLLAEIKCCTTFLDKQIALVQPKLLLALGRIAAHYLLNTTLALGQLRGKIHYYHDIPLIVTYHPAYLLRYSRDKRHAFQDLQLTVKYLESL